MAHNLYNDTMAYTGSEPWHQLGKHCEGAMTAAQAIEMADLGYMVIKEQLLRQDGSLCKGGFATINTDNNKVLGVVGARYEIIQNVRAFDFFDSLIGGEAGAIYQTAGALGDGERIWLLAKLPKSFSPIAGDKIEQYIMLMNSHDGSSPCQVMFTPIRVVCQNTLNMALGKGSTQIVKVRHTLNAEDRLEEAGKIMKEMNDYFTLMGDKCHELGKFIIDDDFINMYKNALFGEEKDVAEGRGRTIRTKKIDAFDGYMANGKGVELPGVKGTAWWPVQAAVEFADYTMPKLGKDPTDCVIFGSGADFKQKAWDKAFAMVGARTKAATNVTTFSLD
jgi:phage/plasmid-like protein (TIGR03299 family)